MRSAICPPLTLPALLALLTACADADAGDPEWTGTREQLGAVEVVRNPAAPMLSGDRVRIERLWETPGATSDTESPDSIWQEARALALADGQVYVLDGMASRVYVVRANDGRQVAAWGRKGKGPGELARPIDIMMLDGSVAVLDPGKGTLERFATDGAMRDPIRLPGITFTARPLGSNRLALGTMKGTEMFRPGAGSTVIELEAPVALPEGPSRECRRLGHVGDAIVRISCIQPHLQLLDTLGRSVREILLGIEPLRTDDALLEKFVIEMRQALAETNLSAPVIESQVASTREAYRFSRRWREVRRDESTGMIALWEQSPEDIERGAARIHLLRPGGEWLATIPFTESWTAFAFGDGTLYALARDPDTDVARLVAYRVDID